MIISTSKRKILLRESATEVYWSSANTKLNPRVFASEEHRLPRDNRFYTEERQREGLGKEAVREDWGVALGMRDFPRSQSLREGGQTSSGSSQPLDTLRGTF